MTRTRGKKRERYVSPTSMAPVVVGFDGADGGRDALELARVLAEIRDSRCIVATPSDGLAEEARAVLDDPEAEVCTIGVLSPPQMLMCEVVVAPRGYASELHGSYAKIAVAVDGTPESKVALARAEDLARQAGAAIEVLVADDPVVASIQAEFPSDAPPSLANVLEAAVGSVDPALSPTGKKVEMGWRQVARTVAAALADACGPDVDLLVTGSRRPIEHFLAGSVTKHLVNESACPVLVVPHTRKV